MVRVERLPDTAQEVLRLLAAGRRLDHELLEDASGLEPRELREALRDAVASHIAWSTTRAGRRSATRCCARSSSTTCSPASAPRCTSRSRTPSSAASPRGRAARGSRRASPSTTAPRATSPPSSRPPCRLPSAADDVRAHGEAAALLERALELWDRVPDAEEHAGVSRVDLLLGAARDHYRASDDARAVTLMEQALGGDRRGDRATARLGGPRRPRDDALDPRPRRGGPRHARARARAAPRGRAEPGAGEAARRPGPLLDAPGPLPPDAGDGHGGARRDRRRGRRRPLRPGPQPPRRRAHVRRRARARGQDAARRARPRAGGGAAGGDGRHVREPRRRAARRRPQPGGARGDPRGARRAAGSVGPDGDLAAGAGGHDRLRPRGLGGVAAPHPAPRARRRHPPGQRAHARGGARARPRRRHGARPDAAGRDR